MDKPETQVRSVKAREVSFTCSVCNQIVTQWRFPSPSPKYCSDECKMDARRAAQKKLMRQRRSHSPPKKRGRPPKKQETAVTPVQRQEPIPAPPPPPKLELDLNPRQQNYLKCIYREDQAAEKHESWRWNYGYSKRPAEEWRWLLYADLAGGATPLKRLLETEGVVDEGTGSTFNALERRGLIEYRERYEPNIMSFEPLTSVKLTRQGRAAARSLLGESAPKKLPISPLHPPELAQ